MSRYAKAFGMLLLAVSLPLAIGALYEYSDWLATNVAAKDKNNQLNADYANVRKDLPAPALLAAQRNQPPVIQNDFRADKFMAWVSHLTPQGTMIRHLAIASGQTSLIITIEWDISGNYPQAENITAGLLAALSQRTQLSNSHLEYKADNQSSFTTVLQPVAGAFRN